MMRALSRLILWARKRSAVSAYRYRVKRTTELHAVLSTVDEALRAAIKDEAAAELRMEQVLNITN